MKKTREIVIKVVVVLILCAVCIAAYIGIEYGRYLLFGDGMDFWKFWWIDTTFRR